MTTPELLLLTATGIAVVAAFMVPPAAGLAILAIGIATCGTAFRLTHNRHQRNPRK